MDYNIATQIIPERHEILRANGPGRLLAGFGRFPGGPLLCRGARQAMSGFALTDRAH